MDRTTLINTKLDINTVLNRFELKLSGGIAFVEFEQRGNTYFLLHTEVPESMTGKGVASILVQKVMNYLLKSEAKMKQFCPYIKAWLKRHPEYLEKFK